MKTIRDIYTESTSSNAIEYITRDVFKGKKPKTAIRSFIKKFKDSDNMFLDETDFDSLYDDYVTDKANTTINVASRFKSGMGHMALSMNADKFKIDQEELRSKILDLTNGKGVNGLI